MEIKVTKTTSPKEKPKKGEKLGFGKISNRGGKRTGNRICV